MDRKSEYEKFKFLNEAAREDKIFDLLLRIDERLDAIERDISRIGRDVDNIERDMVVDVDEPTVYRG